MISNLCSFHEAAAWSGRRLVLIAILASSLCIPAAKVVAQWDNLPRQEPGGTAATTSSWWGLNRYSQLPQAAPAPEGNSIWPSWLMPHYRTATLPPSSAKPPTTSNSQPADWVARQQPPQRLPPVVDARAAQPQSESAAGTAPASAAARPWFDSDLWSAGAMPGASIMRGSSPESANAGGTRPEQSPVGGVAKPGSTTRSPEATAYNGSGLPGTPLAHWQDAGIAPEPAASPSLVAESLPHADGEDINAADYEWTWQMLPQSLIYHTYLAGVKEPRLGAVFNHENQRGSILDLSAGARMGLLRYGTRDVFEPDGWQLDIEGAAFPRLDPEENMDLEACDFKFGVPVTYGWGRYQMKFAYSHLSSHLGDEFALRNGLAGRLNYSRDALVWGHSYYVTDDWRLYFEMGFAPWCDVAGVWDTQFGIEYSPRCNGCGWGAPFVAANTHLRQEVNFGGNFVLQAGWQWTSPVTAHRIRAGIQYYNGQEEQYEFFNVTEQKVGFGLWYDF